MSRWFSKYLISAALDSSKPLMPRLRRKVERSRELRSFLEEALAIDEGLKHRATSTTPTDLHSSIMRRVRTDNLARREHVTQPRGKSFLWVPVPIAAALVMLWVFLYLARPAPNPTLLLESAAGALHSGQELARTLPANVTTPLEEEWRQLKADVAESRDFLAASIP